MQVQVKLTRNQAHVCLNYFFSSKTVISRFMLLVSHFHLVFQNELAKFCRSIGIVRIQVRGHTLSADAKFSEKLTFLTP